MSIRDMSIRDVAVRLLLPALAVSALVIALIALVEARTAHSHGPPTSTMRPTDSVPANPTTFDTDFIGSYQSETDEEGFMVVLPLGNLLDVEVQLRHLSEEDISMHTEFYGIFWQDEHSGLIVPDKDTDYYNGARLALIKGAQKKLILEGRKETVAWHRAELPCRARHKLLEDGELPAGIQNL